MYRVLEALTKISKEDLGGQTHKCERNRNVARAPETVVHEAVRMKPTKDAVENPGSGRYPE